MIQMILKGRIKYITTRKNGDTQIFLKDEPVFLPDDDEIAKKIIDSKGRIGKFDIEENIKSLKIPEKFENLPIYELEKILISIGKNDDRLKKQDSYIEKIKESIKSGLIELRKPEPEIKATGNTKVMIAKIAALEKSNKEKDIAFDNLKKASESSISELLKNQNEMKKEFADFKKKF